MRMISKEEFDLVVFDGVFCNENWKLSFLNTLGAPMEISKRKGGGYCVLPKMADHVLFNQHSVPQQGQF